MGRLGLIVGHSLLGDHLGELLGISTRTRDVPAAARSVRVSEGEGVVVVQRHGELVSVPAPWIDHHAHAAALAALGCDHVLALSSVGSLHARHPVGTVLIPDDFISLAAQPESRFVDARGHRVPTFDARWRARVLAAWRLHAPEAPVDGGVYWQTVGPRFETPAEVRMLATFADVVGMTLGSECVACTEQDLAYAAVAVVDNLANGVEGNALSIAQFEEGNAANRLTLAQTLRSVVRDLRS